jgi:hypothetical protein
VTWLRLRVALVADEPGRRYRLELVVADGAPRGRFEGTVRIETSSPELPVVEVPVRGRIG